MDNPERNAFRFDLQPRGALGRAALSATRPLLERASGLHYMHRLYNRTPPELHGAELLAWVLRDLDVRVDVSDADLQRIPAEGAAVLVANHPYGLIEGMLLPPLLAERRSDYRLMANYLLGRIPELRELFVYVDPFETGAARRANTAPLRAALRWVAEGGLLAGFPAGEVASLHVRERQVLDPPWNHAFARAARHAECPVVPLWISGHNGWAFQTAGLLHPALRTALLCRQVAHRRGGTIEVRVGNPIPWKRLQALRDDAERTEYMRERVGILAERPAAVQLAAPAVQPRRTPKDATPVADPVDPALLEAEISGLPEENHLVAAEMDVFVARADEIPYTLREIGRLREHTFRQVGEGTGRGLDLDRFDETYLHLFVWNREEREVVGAYRLGRVDRLLETEGPSGLYTRTLFKFAPPFWEQLGCALEMGRSFIRPKYQRSYAGLMLLWRGIGRYVSRHPRYTKLFGPVSISADYTDASQRLIVEFLKQNRFAHDWSRWVRPRRPFKARALRGGRLRPEHLADLQDVSTFISEVESDGKGVPILLRQYLKLGGRLLGFNVDPDFSNVLDVMVVVDLLQTDRKVLNRYMNRDAAEAFCAFHRDAEPGLG